MFNKNDDIHTFPKLMGKDEIKSNFQNWTLTYKKDVKWDIVDRAMKVMQKGLLKSKLNRTPAKISIRFYDEHKDKHLPNQDYIDVFSTLGVSKFLKYKGCPIKRYNFQTIDPYSQHLEFILTLECESYRNALKLAHKLKRLKTINSVEVTIDTLKFK